MISKYINRSIFILLWTLISYSCLRSTQNDIELSKDAQIYSFSLESKKDTTRALAEARFTIDQINGKIFNQDSLPYLFHVDSVDLEVSGKTTNSLSKISLSLKDKDSTYVWNGKDSVVFKRLKSIETIAQDGKKSKVYQITINVHQQDPYIFTWAQPAKNYISFAVNNQKTIVYKTQFITYYISGNSVRASVASSKDAATWTPVTISGLPSNVNLNSILTVNNNGQDVIYARDANNEVYSSINATSWSKINTSHPVVAIYKSLPSASGVFGILSAVKDGNQTKFALTTDFNSIKVLNQMPNDFPVSGFSAISIENPSVFGAKFVVVNGGKSLDGKTNDKVWIVQEKNNEIKYVSEKPSFGSLDGQLFLYDGLLYMLNYDGEKNNLYFSSKYGLDWKPGSKEQALPKDFTKRKNSSVITDESNYIWIFGGESDTQSQIVDVWRGRLNKLAK